MRFALILTILLLFSSIAHARITSAPASAPACKNDDRNEQAIETALQEGNDTDSDVNVRVLKICGDYAKAMVTTVEDNDTETAYLKKIDGEWTILDLGNGTDPVDLHIPKKVW